MESGKSVLKWAGMIAAAAATLLVCTEGFGVATPSAADEKGRADIVTIDVMKRFGRLERPAVLFMHDRHTEALKASGKDCSACHMKDDKGRMSINYQRLEDVGKTETMNIYHDNCIACHTDTISAGQKSGPVTCGGCHVRAPTVVSDWQPIGLDKSLHFRHVKAAQARQKDCGLCHHAYDEQTKSLFYDKGKEGTCRYCHQETDQENRIAFRKASHMDCVSCHRETQDLQKDAGPVDCAGCHSLEAQKAIAVLEEVPRMERNQPDAVFVKSGKDVQRNPDGSTPLRMPGVPFDHKGHEAYNDNCRVCHHASLASCNDCHTVAGHKDGNFVKLSEAMHMTGDRASCIGCHTEEKRDPSCAGCHAFQEVGRQLQDEAACLQCHLEGAPAAGDLTGSDAEKAMAARMLENRPTVVGTYADADIPEKVVIDKVDLPETTKLEGVSVHYDVVEMPHRKIVKALVGRIGDNPLAAHFHTDPGTLCQGCHHQSPPSKTPPQCSSCHGRPFDERRLNVPGLFGAYHQQCMGCHEQMGLLKLNECAACHKDKP